jgi:hypothetical protein
MPAVADEVTRILEWSRARSLKCSPFPVLCNARGKYGKYGKYLGRCARALSHALLPLLSIRIYSQNFEFYASPDSISAKLSPLPLSKIRPSLPIVQSMPYNFTPAVFHSETRPYHISPPSQLGPYTTKYR